jgi:hypothetical protein
MVAVARSFSPTQHAPARLVPGYSLAGSSYRMIVQLMRTKIQHNTTQHNKKRMERSLLGGRTQEGKKDIGSVGVL